VTAILGGLGAATMWATSTLSTSRSTKIVSPSTVLACVMAIGAALAAPAAFASGVPPALRGVNLLWLLVSGVANLLGLLLAYSALRIGKVGVVAPITSAQGAAAAIIAILAGERIAPGSGPMLALIALGVALASLSGTESANLDHDRRAPLLAGAAAALFGLGLYASGRLSNELPLAWILFVPRLVGVLVFALPMALLGRVRLRRAAVPYIVLSGVCELLGLAAFTLGARGGIAVAAILASQFAALAAVSAYVLFGERLRRIQVAGVAAILVGVAVLTGLQA
jgi:drug/metabolite transporter (DMT)-like permease